MQNLVNLIVGQDLTLLKNSLIVKYPLFKLNKNNLKFNRKHKMKIYKN